MRKKAKKNRLSWNEIRARATRFAEKFKDARRERGETQTFYNEFFEIFGIERWSVARYEEHVKKITGNTGYIDLFWPGVLVIEQKSAGKDLSKAEKQAGDYFDSLSHDEQPRYQLVSDFQSFRLRDRDERKDYEFTLKELPENVKLFSFMLDTEEVPVDNQAPVSIKAAELMGKIHDGLEKGKYTGHDLEVFLTRLTFCLFADNTDIFEPNILLKYLKNRTCEDGSDTGIKLIRLFEVLNKPIDERQDNLDEDLNAFPYVNGSLFEDMISIPDFNSAMRKNLLEACEFDWSGISPAIFGSLFQSVMDKEQRRKSGAHYTTEENILKVIGPLFLDDLEDEFSRIKMLKKGSHRKKRLEEFHGKLAKLKFFDPACGCGNFLIVTYREIRALEIEVLKESYADISLALDVEDLCRIDVDQFYGIEISEFPAKIAEIALWMTDHIMNRKLGDAFGEAFLRIPLKKSPHIYCGDALETEWEDVLKSDECSYVIGNPPFMGAKNQSTSQREQVRRIADLGGSGGSLDFVAAWFIKAGAYGVPFSFVATSSICQGEQVAQLWPVLLDDHNMRIAFAHQAFAWGSEARGKAAVYVIVLGLEPEDISRKTKSLFTYEDSKGEPSEVTCKIISPYLFVADKLKNPHIVVKSSSRTLNGLSKLGIGSKPIDGSYFIFNKEERDEFLTEEPAASEYVRPYIGAREFLHSEERHILCTSLIPPHAFKSLPRTQKIIEQVKQYRLGKIPPKGKEVIKKPGMSSLELAETPAQFHVTVIPENPFLVFPGASSETRKYVPISWVEPSVVPSNAVLITLDVPKSYLSLFSSAIHMLWLRTVGGRLEGRVRYSAGLVYNTFPMPPAEDMSVLDSHAQAILDARALYPESSLADLYSSIGMPPELVKAHKANDKAVERLYRKQAFKSESERIGHLLGLYEEMVQKDSKPSKRRKVKSKSEPLLQT